MKIIGLGYVGLTVSDLDGWIGFARDVIGLDPGRAPLGQGHVPGGDWRGPDGSAWFRIDDWSWRLAIHPGEQAGLAYLGLELAGQAELDGALEELRGAGHPARAGTVEECVARAVSGIGFTRDPGGNVIELFHGPQIMDGYRNSHGMEFLTGALGMGHVNLFASDYAKSQAFYTGLLGFRMTDYYRVGPGQTVNFFHVNPRHHTVGLMDVAPVDGIHHLMLEVTELDMVGLALDRVMAAGCRITASLGRHSNDRIVSFYCESPSGVEVEIGWGAITVGADWTPRYRAPGDLWGHHGLTAENIGETGRAL